MRSRINLSVKGDPEPIFVIGLLLDVPLASFVLERLFNDVVPADIGLLEDSRSLDGACAAEPPSVLRRALEDFARGIPQPQFFFYIRAKQVLARFDDVV